AAGSNGSTTIAQYAMLMVAGWSADREDGAPVSRVQILIDGKVVGNATLGGARPDVASFYGDTRYTNSGFNFSYNIGGMATGAHTVNAVATDSAGASTNLAYPVTI